MLRALVVSVLVGLAVAPAAAASGGHGGWGKQFSPGAPGIGDPYFPLDGNGGYDVRHYELDLRYDPATDVLAGVAKIRAEARQNLSSFNLDLVGHERARDLRRRAPRRLEPRRRRADRRRRAAGCARASGFDDGRRLRRRAGDDRPSSAISGFIHTDDGTLVAGQPDVGRDLVPGQRPPARQGVVHVRASRSRPGLEAVANGVLEDRDTRRGWTTWAWEAREPMALVPDDGDDRRVRPARVPRATASATGTRSTRTCSTTVAAAHRRAQYAISQAASVSYKRLTRTIDVPAGGATAVVLGARATPSPTGTSCSSRRTPAGADDWTTLPDVNGHTSHEHRRRRARSGSSCTRSSSTTSRDERRRRRARRRERPARGRRRPARSDGYEQWTVDLSRLRRRARSRSRSATRATTSSTFSGRVRRRHRRSRRRRARRRSRTTATRWTAGRVPGAPAGSAAERERLDRRHGGRRAADDRRAGRGLARPPAGDHRLPRGRLRALPVLGGRRHRRRPRAGSASRSRTRRGRSTRSTSSPTRPGRSTASSCTSSRTSGSGDNLALAALAAHLAQRGLRDLQRVALERARGPRDRAGDLRLLRGDPGRRRRSGRVVIGDPGPDAALRRRRSTTAAR